MAIYPIEADKYVVASEFAKRIIRDKATEPEIAFMVKFVDLSANDVRVEDLEFLEKARLDIYGIQQMPEGLRMGAIQYSK